MTFFKKSIVLALPELPFQWGRLPYESKTLTKEYLVINSEAIEGKELASPNAYYKGMWPRPGRGSQGKSPRK